MSNRKARTKIQASNKKMKSDLFLVYNSQNKSRVTYIVLSIFFVFCWLLSNEMLVVNPHWK